MGALFVVPLCHCLHFVPFSLTAERLLSYVGDATRLLICAAACAWALMVVLRVLRKNIADAL